MAVRGCSLLSALLCARIMSVDAFGQLGFWQSTVTSAVSFGATALGMSANSLVARQRLSDAGRAFRTLTTVLVIAVAVAVATSLALALFAPVVVGTLPVGDEVSTDLALVAGNVFIGILNTVAAGAAAGLGLFRLIATTNAINASLVLLLLPLAAWLAGPTGVLSGLLAIAVLVAVRWFVSVVMPIPATIGGWRNSVRASESRVVAGFALPTLLSSFVTAPAVWYGTLLMARSENGFAQVAVASAALQWHNLLTFLQLAISPALVTSLAECRGSNDWVRYWSLFAKSFRTTAWLAGGAAVVIALLSPVIMAAYGEAYRDAWPVLVFLALAGMLSSIASTVANVIVTASSMWWAVALNAVWALVFVSTAVLLVPSHGALGLAHAYAVSYAAHALLVGIFARNFRLRSLRSIAAEPGAGDVR